MRLIDANELDRQASARAGCASCNNYNGVRCRACSWDDFLEMIEDAQTVDSVPIRVVAQWLAKSYVPEIEAIIEVRQPGETTEQAWAKAWEKVLREKDWEEA